MRRAASEYALVVARQPDVFRFMLHSHFTQRSDDTGRALQSARQSAERAAALFAGAVDDESVRVADAELVIYSIFGAVASATDWWLGTNRLEPPAMPVEQFAAYLSEIIFALVAASARLHGIAITADLPLHRAFSSL